MTVQILIYFAVFEAGLAIGFFCASLFYLADENAVNKNNLDKQR